MSNSDILGRLDAALAKRRDGDPAKSYTASLYTGGVNAISAKITEEAAEVVEAAGENDDEHLIHEVADLWFHTMVLLQSRGLNTSAVQAELARRFGVSGIEEKAGRGQSDTSAN